LNYKLIDIDESYTELETDDINFKKRVIETLSVFEEGYKFSPLFRCGAWDGKKHFYEIMPTTNLQFPKGLVEYIIKDLRESGYDYEYNSTSVNYDITLDEINSFIETLKLPFPPYDYQVTAAFDMIKYKRGVIQASTGSGKSLIIYIYLMFMSSIGKKTALVVPSINLVSQMYTDFIDYGLKDPEDKIRQIGGEYKNKDLLEKDIIVSTWQSLQNFKEEQFKIFDAIIIDEAHTAAADSLTNILNFSINAQWKFGLTGTVPRKRVDKLQLLGTLGRVFKIITPGELIERGLATPIRINCLYLNYSQADARVLHKGKDKFLYPDEEKFIAQHHYRNKKASNLMEKLSGSGNVLGLFSKIEHGELLLKNAIALRTNDTNFELLHKLTPKPMAEAIDSYIQFPKTFYMNSEIDKEKIEKAKKKLLKDYKPEIVIPFLESIKSLREINIFFITGAVSGSAREDIRMTLETVHSDNVQIQFEDKEEKFEQDHEFTLEDGSIKKAKYIQLKDSIKGYKGIIKISDAQGAIVLGSWQIVATGANYKNLRHIVYLSSLKSFTKVVQSIGRGMRLHKKKTIVDIWDIIDDITLKTERTEKSNYVLRHFHERLEYYRESEYKINEKEMELQSDKQEVKKEQFNVNMDEW